MITAPRGSPEGTFLVETDEIPNEKMDGFLSIPKVSSHFVGSDVDFGCPQYPLLAIHLNRLCVRSLDAIRGKRTKGNEGLVKCFSIQSWANENGTAGVVVVVVVAVGSCRSLPSFKAESAWTGRWVRRITWGFRRQSHVELPGKASVTSKDA